MFDCIKKLIRSPLAELALVAIIALNFIPGIDFWYELNSIQTTKQTYKVGEEIHLFIDHESKTENEGYSRLRVYEEGIGEPKAIYEEIGSIKHEIPMKIGYDGITKGTPLGWVIGELDELNIEKPGFYKAEVCVRVSVPFFSDRDKCVESNIFEIISPTK